MAEKKAPTTPVKVIRAKCLDCSCGNAAEVARCPVERCPLWPWRMGKNPYTKKRQYSEEEKERKREILRKLNEQRKAENASAEASGASS